LQKNSFLKYFLLLLLLLALNTSTGLAQTPVIAPSLARDLAFSQIQRASSRLQQWQGAIPGAIIPHYDLDNQLSAYVFSVVKDGKIVGSITISAPQLTNPVLEYSTAAPRSQSSLADSQILAETLGTRLDSSHPLYLGMLAYFYRLESNGPSKLVEMSTQRVFQLENLLDLPVEDQSKNQISKLEDQAENIASKVPAIAPAQTSFKLLKGPDYSWYRGCGPTATANVMGHWSDRGYPNLVYGGSAGNYSGTIDRLAELMHTSPEGWTNLPIDDDIRKFASERGYSFKSTETVNPSYSRYTQSIDAHRPIVVLVNGHDLYGDHFITGFGYEYDPNDINYRYMIVHDTWGSTPTDYWVQFGAGYKKIWFDTVEPPSIQVDSTPPSSYVLDQPSFQTEPDFRVDWSGTDNPGGWGLEGYDVQVRIGEVGEWTDWLTHTEGTEAIFYGNRGDTVYFRSRAYDIDGNLEEYPSGDGDTYTVISRYLANGQVRNNRGLPVLLAQVETSPANLGPVWSDAAGHFSSGFRSTGIYQFMVSNSNYGSLPPMLQVDVSADVNNLIFIMPPSKDQLLNGGFENGSPDPWIIAGSITPILSSQAHTGGHAILLGGEASPPGGNSSLSQNVILEPDGKSPVLSFVYRPLAYTPGDLLKVEIISSSTTQSYPLDLAASYWTHTWFDLTAFSGEPVEIRLVLERSTSGDSRVLLDEISLGAAGMDVQTVYLPLSMQDR
jgi:hypothetical protein